MDNKIIDLYRCNNPVIRDTFEATVFNIRNLKEKYNHTSFLLCGCEPKVGTTSTAVELAISLSAAGCATVLLDGSLRKDNRYKRLSDETPQGLADFISGDMEVADIIYHTNWEKLDYVPGGEAEESNPMSLLFSKKADELMQRLNADYEYVIIDGPSVSTAVDSQIFAVKANATILVAAMVGTKKKVLMEAKKQLESSGANIVGVIANKVSMPEFKQYIKNYNYYNKKQFLKRSKTTEKQWSGKNA